MDPMRYSIGEASRASELSIKAIRHYEEIGLTPSPSRRTNGSGNGGHRIFTPAEIDRLKFIRRARMLDLGLDDIRRLLAVRDSGTCPGTEPEYDRILDRHLGEIEGRIAHLRELSEQIRELRSRDPHPNGCTGERCACLRPEADFVAPHGRPTGKSN